ncbi:glycosyltransferase family 2 protein [Algibacter miyuki]|uniref:Glycosyltransferase family 2 protein n=1 Tax=Algibacter miyuki TaxID=1306933 RepID=A0ABV5GZM4_9FLAO|nr:glycosyltransferase [Algibacter miyuki]MDN3666877.1 glycosyltransferase [Algibacter miyuki]
MKLSVIIPVYNVERYIIRCLDSLVHQGLNEGDYEIIIVNDGSNDASMALIESYKWTHENIFVLNQENRGVGAARNTGLYVANGEYIYFLDPDDYLANDVLKTLLNYAIEHQPDVLTFKSQPTELLTLVDSKSNLNDELEIDKKSGIDYIASHGFQNEVWWYFINRNFLKSIELQFIEGRWMEDAIFTGKILVKANNVIHLPIDAHRYVRNYGSAMTSKEPNHYLKVIDDNANAAVAYHSIINNLKINNKACLVRLRAKQQSFVFFLLNRILKSTMKRSEILPLLEKMQSVNAYPLNAFIGQDYNGLGYFSIAKIFSKKYLFYFIFLVTNPFLKRSKY